MPATYPNRLIAKGETDTELVNALQAALAGLGYPCATPGVFDADMVSAVKRFQATHVDAAGNPLKVDGTVGRLTWGAIFGVVWQPPLPTATTASLIATTALAVASTQIGVREDPGRPNRGPMVDEYLRETGLNPAGGGPSGYPWCQAFVYWCFKQAATKLGVPSYPAIRTAGVLDHWSKAATHPKAKRYTLQTVLKDLSIVSPGALVVYDFGGGMGHIAFVEQCRVDGTIVSVEGNSNETGGREGVGVFRLQRRKIAASEVGLKGIIVYSD